MAYLLPILFIVGWWYFGFSKPPTLSLNEVKLVSQQHLTQAAPLFGMVRPLVRSELKQALDGDLGLMARLITEWDQDAQILETQGWVDVAKLSRSHFIKALMLERTLRLKKTAPSPQKYLPQTWASASFLLALLPPEQIAALPKGYKSDLAPFLPTLSGECAEFVWQHRPALAFVAPYSQPGVIQILQAQNIPVHMARRLNTFDDITQELEMTGAYTGKKEEAELMSLFMQAALMAIDNRAKLLNPYDKTLYLSWGSYFSYPTRRTLTGQLLDRLHLNSALQEPSGLAWKVPIDKESLRALKPSRLIIACENPAKFVLPEWEGPLEITLVEETLLESPDQYIVLAYYDLYEALAR